MAIFNSTTATTKYRNNEPLSPSLLMIGLAAIEMAISGERKKKLFLALFASVLVVTAIVTIATTVSFSKKKSSNTAAAHSIIKSSCSATLYPELCYSTISSAPDAETKVKNPKDVIELSLNLTVTAVQSNYLSIKKLISTRRKSLTEREKAALNDCLELVDETLDELFIAEHELGDYPSFNKSISQHADDLKSLLSAAMTNQETCLDGFSHDNADKKVFFFSFFFFLILNHTSLTNICVSDMLLFGLN